MSGPQRMHWALIHHVFRVGADAKKRAAVIYLRSVGRDRMLSAGTLTEMFGPTAAEAETAILASSRQTARELADLRGVSAETLRSQLKAAHAKMGTRTRSELVAQISRLQATIGRVG